MFYTIDLRGDYYATLRKEKHYFNLTFRHNEWLSSRAIARLTVYVSDFKPRDAILYFTIDGRLETNFLTHNKTDISTNNIQFSSFEGNFPENFELTDEDLKEVLGKGLEIYFSSNNLHNYRNSLDVLSGVESLIQAMNIDW